MIVVTANVRDSDRVELPSNVSDVDFSARRRGQGYLLYLCARARSDSRYGTTEYEVRVHDLGTKADHTEVETEPEAAFVESVNVQRNRWVLVELVEVN